MSRADGRLATMAVFALTGGVFMALGITFAQWFTKYAATELPTGFQLVLCPSLSFTLGILFAAIIARVTGCLPKPQAPYSMPRLVAGTFVMGISYPIGFLVILLIVYAGLILFSSSSSSGDSLWRTILSMAILTGILTVSGMVCVFLAALAVGIATRAWSRRVYLWVVGIPLLTLILSIFANYFQAREKFSNYPVWQSFFNDPLRMFTGIAWGLPLQVIIGLPMLAGAVGYWLQTAVTAADVDETEPGSVP